MMPHRGQYVYGDRGEQFLGVGSRGGMEGT
jgi:hypothetical protein